MKMTFEMAVRRSVTQFPALCPNGDSPLDGTMLYHSFYYPAVNYGYSFSKSQITVSDTILLDSLGKVCVPNRALMETYWLCFANSTGSNLLLSEVAFEESDLSLFKRTTSNYLLYTRYKNVYVFRSGGPVGGRAAAVKYKFINSWVREA